MFDTQYPVQYIVNVVFAVLKKVCLKYTVKSPFNISLKVVISNVTYRKFN
jgi:hypothetical protein